jgi:diguanylate cyclase (GGDEF)-like protein/PAS domain S-box-containing protein
MTEAVVLLDNRERIVVANAAFWLLTGRAPGELLGRSPSCLSWKRDTPGNDGPATLPWQETLADGAPCKRQRLTYIDDAGSTRILSAGTAAITDPDGRARGVLLTLDDITVTEELNAEHAGLVAQLARSREELHRKNEELQILATTDLLTGGLTRRALFENFHRMWSHAQRRRAPLACIMIDVDHFKAVNDKHGHSAGDQVLREVGLRLREAVRTEDLVGRYGGEEFCVIAPDTPITGARVLAERIRESIQSAPCAGLSVTVSLGIAVMNARTPSFEALIATADNGLYAAKRSGRNRVAVGDPPDIARAA